MHSESLKITGIYLVSSSKSKTTSCFGKCFGGDDGEGMQKVFDVKFHSDDLFLLICSCLVFHIVCCICLYFILFIYLLKY